MESNGDDELIISNQRYDISWRDDLWDPTIFVRHHVRPRMIPIWFWMIHVSILVLGSAIITSLAVMGDSQLLKLIPAIILLQGISLVVWRSREVLHRAIADRYILKDGGEVAAMLWKGMRPYLHICGNTMPPWIFDAEDLRQVFSRIYPIAQARGLTIIDEVWNS